LRLQYYVGISSTRGASRDDRVCVLNILGGESSDVTPVSHAYSGGNVVCGTAPGKGGAVLETSIGNIPVYNSVRDALVAGRRFNCGVVYLPPSAARDGVAELIRVNPDLRKIFIITEKIAVHDAREIRAMGQHNGVDIFGANGLGVAIPARPHWRRTRRHRPSALRARLRSSPTRGASPPPSHSTSVWRAGVRPPSSRRARTSTSITRRRSSPLR
jgi:hypothetical protein